MVANIRNLPVVHKKKKLERLDQKAKKIREEQNSLSTAFVRLDQASKSISSAITSIEELKLKPKMDQIDALNLDTEYKDNLKKELTSSRDQALDTLKPLLDTAEKLKGNMLVTQDKALYYLSVVKAQIDIHHVAEVQVKTIKGLQGAGQSLDSEIRGLLKECERINSVTQMTVQRFAPDGNYFKESQVALGAAVDV